MKQLIRLEFKLVVHCRHRYRRVDLVLLIIKMQQHECCVVVHSIVIGFGFRFGFRAQPQLNRSIAGGGVCHVLSSMCSRMKNIPTSFVPGASRVYFHHCLLHPFQAPSSAICHIDSVRLRCKNQVRHVHMVLFVEKLDQSWGRTCLLVKMCTDGGNGSGKISTWFLPQYMTPAWLTTTSPVEDSTAV